MRLKLLLVAAGLWAVMGAAMAEEAALPSTLVTPADTQRERQQLREAAEAIGAGRLEDALAQLDAIIAFYDGRMTPGTQTYSARTQPETMLYVLKATTESKSATVLDSTIGDAHYLRAYALTEQRRLDEAWRALDRALALSPHNALFQAERGNQLERRRQWDAALAVYKAAEEDARTFSPEGTRRNEQGRAIRGQGYALVELQRFEEAERAYLRCLALDPADGKASAELGYVREQMARRRP